jgi:DNA replication protein DnaC
MPPIEQITKLLHRLRMPHARGAINDLLADARTQRWDPGQLLQFLLEKEVQGREKSMRDNRRKKAQLPSNKTFEAWDEKISSIPLVTQSYLRTLEWIKKKDNLVLAGPTGTGKTFFIEALCQSAIDQDLKVTWLTLEKLATLVNAHRIDGSINKAIDRLAGVDLIVIDDIGLLPVSKEAAEGFYRLIDAAYEKHSIAVSSNIHPSGFDQIMPKTLATAAVDRLLHHATICETEGESIRLTQALKNNKTK